MDNKKKILDALDFTPEPFYYLDGGLDKYVVLCFLCEPNFWDECVSEAAADLVLKEHVFTDHTSQEDDHGFHDST